MRSLSIINQAAVRLSAAKPVHWDTLPVTREVGPHGHEFTEICIVLKGSAIHSTSSKDSLIEANHVLVMPPGSVHAFAKPKGLEVINIYFLPEWFLPELRLADATDGVLPIFFASALSGKTNDSHIHEWQIKPETSASIQRELRDLSPEQSLSRSSRWASCCFFKVLLFLLEALYELPSPKPPSFRQFSEPIWKTLAEIDRVISAGETLDLSALARQLGMTRDHLGRLFDQQAGVTPTAFYQRRRAQFACRLLLSSDQTLSDIAFQLGYADEAHMCRIFRREQGLTPGGYRKKFRP